MQKNTSEVTHTPAVGMAINNMQTLFVGVLKVWTIPIVLMLSIASGFTTFYGLSHFIIPWIALVITVAIQSIVVICSLEMAGIHFKANRTRYLSVLLSLLIALTASVSFSYFKFYEISQKDNIHITRINELRLNSKTYIKNVLAIKQNILAQHRTALEKASHDASQAYFGTHPDVALAYRNQVGKGPFWKHYNDIYQTKKLANDKLSSEFSELDKNIKSLQMNLADLDVSIDTQAAYFKFLTSFQDLQFTVNQLTSQFGIALPDAPLLQTYKQFSAGVTPSLALWSNFSLFAFICAAMVDFFTVLLSYRLEFTAPGPLTADEEELIFDCLRQFSQFRINENDELEMIIEKSELEKARNYSDWSRMFAVGLLLSRGFLRKIDHRTVEFSPNLYPLVAEKMSTKIKKLRAELAQNAVNSHD